MLFEVLVRGRRLSDGHDYELRVTVPAESDVLAAESIEDYDWTDAATRHVRVAPLEPNS